MAGFGGAVKLTGESEYRQALKLITQNLKTLSSEMKVVSTQYAQNDKSVATLVERNRTLENILQKQKAALQQATAAYTSFKSKVQEQTAAHQKLEQEYKDAVTELERIRKECGETSQEYQEQAQKVDKLAQEYQKSAKAEAENAVALGKLETKMNEAQAEVNQTTNEMKEYDDALNASRAATSKLSDGFTTMKMVLANLVTDGIRRAVQGLKDLSKQIVRTGAEFDATMSSVEAISGATAEEMEELTAKAKEMGETTRFTASEAGDALKYMAMAGWKTEDMLSGLEGIMYLAAASGEDLGTTSDIVTDALTAMGYAAGDAGELANVMAAASSNANTNVSLMGKTFQYAAPIVGALGYNMEDTAVAIGLMANSGIKGTKAGTALRSMLTRLSSPPKAAAEAIEELGLSLTDSEGNMKSLDEVMRDLRGAFADLSATEKTHYANAIAGKTAMTGLLAIVNTGQDDFDRLTQAVNASSGAAQRMSNTMQDNVSGQFTILKSQIEGIYLTIYNQLEPTFRRAMREISKTLRELDWESFGRMAGNALAKVVDGFTWILEHGREVLSVITGLMAAFVAAKVASFAMSIASLASGLMTAYAAVGSLTGALSAMGLTMLANPIVALTAAVVGLGVAMYALTKDTDEATQEQEEYNRVLEDQLEGIRENRDAWDELNKTRQESLNTGLTELDHYKSLYDELTGLVDANGKVKKGYEGRAAFIVGTLKDALGLEIDMVDGVIEGYDELTKSIDEVMEKKKAQIILDSQESMYGEAISKQAEAVAKLVSIQDDLTEKKEEQIKINSELSDLYEQQAQAALDGDGKTLRSLQEVIAEREREAEVVNQNVADLETSYAEQEDLYAEYVYNIGQYEKNMALAHEGRYDEMSTVSWNYVSDMDKAGQTEKENLEQQIAEEKKSIKLLKEYKKQTGEDVYDEQIEQHRKTLKELKKQLKTYEETTGDGLGKVTEKWIKTKEDILSDLTGSNVQFKQTGEDTVQVYIDGIATGEETSKEEMDTIVSGMLQEANGKTAEFNTVGANYVAGIGNGIDSGSGSVFTKIKNFGASMLQTLKNALKEQSPSKATAEMGVNFAKGFENGLESELKATESTVYRYGKDTLKTFEEVTKVMNKVVKENADKTGAEIEMLFVSAGKTRISELEKANKITLTEEVNFWQMMVGQVAKGTEAYKQASANLREAKNNLKNSIAQVTEAYLADVQKANEELDKNIKDLQAKYKDAVAKSKESIMKSFGLFDAANFKEKTGTEDLLKNLNSQVKALQQYQKVMDKLRSRIKNEDLIKELEAQGVDALPTLQSILAMSDSELKEYEVLYAKKEKLAGELAKKENADLLADTNKQIADLKEKAEKQIKALSEAYTKNLKALGVEGNKESKDVGKMIASGIKTGFKNGMKDVKKSAKEQLKSLLDAIKKELEIKSPSRVFRDQVGDNMALGVGEGFVDTMKDVTQQMTEAIPKTLDAAPSLSGARYERDQIESAAMVSAFKSALSQMKIVLDDEVAGAFVDKTVTNLIYT